jgi:hypothetical protein
LPQPRKLHRIERHRRDRPAVSGEHFSDAKGEAAVAVKTALQFEKHRHTPAKEVAKLAERHHTLVAATECDAPERRGAYLIKPIFALSKAPELGVVMHHGFAVGANLQIDLDAATGGQGRAHGACGILDDAMRSVMQPAMGDWPRGEPIECGHYGMIRKKPAPDLIRGGNRFSEKIMLHQKLERQSIQSEAIAL